MTGYQPIMNVKSLTRGFSITAGAGLATLELDLEGVKIDRRDLRPGVNMTKIGTLFLNEIWGS